MDSFAEAMHAARLAFVDASLRALIAERSDRDDVMAVAVDGVRVTLTELGVDVEYLAGDVVVAGEGL